MRLHPLSAGELGLTSVADLDQLMTLGGLPEPYLGGSEKLARRWAREYRDRFIHTEVGSLERISDLGQLELMMLGLPELVGAPLSINALSEDLQVSHKTVARWLAVFERLYAVFRVPPFGAPRIRAAKKAQKHYHWDWSIVPEPAARFENLIACHLLKWVHHQQDTDGRDVELRYFRDVDGREVDFVVVERRKPLLFVECKISRAAVSTGLRYLRARFPAVESWQVILHGQDDLVQDGVRVSPALTFLRRLP